MKRLPLAGPLLALAACAAPEQREPPPPPRPAPEIAAPVAGPAARAERGGSLLDPATEAQAPPAAPETSQSAPDQEPQPETRPAPAPAGAERPIGWVAGQPIPAEELLLEWGDVASRELFLIVDKLVSVRLTLAEAARLGVRLAPEAVELRFQEDRKELERGLERSGKKRTLEEYIRKDLGFEPERYLERVRRATIRQMLAERVVRLNSLGSESLALRLIVVPDEARMAEVQAALGAGRDFAEVAREFSVDDSKARGGLVPFVVAQERSPLARIAFQTPVGETAGPVESADHLFLLRVEERRTPLEGDWRALEETIEASLRDYPVTESEFLNWKLAMEGRYPIDLEPLRELVGAER
jgi:hypothetical protein